MIAASTQVRSNAAVRVAVVTNIPAPYRVPVFNQLAVDPALDLHVLYAARKEADRDWDLPVMAHAHSFLNPSVFQRRNGRFFHNNPDVFGVLRRFSPEVVITTGFNPTHVYAFAYAKLNRRRHIVMSDGTPASEAHLSWLHRSLRRVLVGRSDAWIVASDAGRGLLRSHGAAEPRIHKSPLCANPLVEWRCPGPGSRDYDLLFSGRLVDVKNPLFAIDVARGAAQRLSRRVRLAMLGTGPLESVLHRRAEAVGDDVEVEFAGNVAQSQVPRWFERARVFLFPSSWDPWGVVANEACLAGVPSIVSPHAGVSGELILDGVNGFIRPLEPGGWVDAAVALLSDATLHEKLSVHARLSVQAYCLENAVSGIRAAIFSALA